MKENTIGILTSDMGLEDNFNIEAELTTLVSEWIEAKSAFIRSVWSKSSVLQKNNNCHLPEEAVEEIIKILTHRVFNYQSKCKLDCIISNVRNTLLRTIKNNQPIHFFLLYNGGYRASPFQELQSLVFEPDQTELMLLYQIALLYQKITSFYPPGISFSIVVNNGVAKWVNDIPIADTENYAHKFRNMISSFGAEEFIQVLLQSELPGFDPEYVIAPLDVKSGITEEDLLMVERFVGRSISREEAEYRASLYPLAEFKWAKDLGPLIAEKNGIIMRQVAHPEMLSFRPFPGGAIRVQNGTFGFMYQKKSLKPKLITSRCANVQRVKWIPNLFSRHSKIST